MAPTIPKYDFGGPYVFLCTVSAIASSNIFTSLGAAALVLGLPALLEFCYFACNDLSGCPAPALLQPSTLTWANLKLQIPWPAHGARGFVSWEIIGWVLAYYLLSLVLYRVLPAHEVYGMKLRESGRPLLYRFNGELPETLSQSTCVHGINLRH